MRRRLWFSVVSSTIGLSMLLAAGFASPAESGTAKSEGRGGTLRLGSSSDFDFIDPSLAYFSHSWQMLDAVCMNLYRYPDAEGNAGVRPIPGTAAGFPKFSNRGRRVTITVRRNYARFQNGQAVTARSYANAMQRNLDPRMQSPAAAYMEEIKGAKAVLNRRANRASGIRVSGNRLILDLVKPVPDIVNRLTMAFFCPQPGNGLPRNPQGINAPFSGAGPYYVAQWTPRRSAVLERNPFWRGAITRTRAANVDRMEYTIGISPAAQKLQIDRNELDLGAVPPAEVAGLVQQHGLNKGRLFLRKQMVFWYLIMNHDRPLFGPQGGNGLGNVPLKKAVNFAIDRPSLVRQHGFLAGARTDQIIPYTMPGFRNWDIYPLRGANAQRANQLAQGRKRDGKVVMYTFNVSHGPPVAQVVQQNLNAIGLDVEVRSFDRVVQHEKAATRGEPFDMTYEGWGADYADPITFFNTLFWGGNIQQANNVNESYFNSPRFNRMILQAAETAGTQRFTRYASLDRLMMRDAAPVAPFINTNARIYVSESLGCYKYAPAHGVTNLVAVCKK